MIDFKYRFISHPLFAVEPDTGTSEDPASAGASDANDGMGAPADLDAIISKAMEGRSIGDEAPAADVDPNAPPATDGRKHGPDGRFVSAAKDAPGDAGSADLATKAAQSHEGEQPAPAAQSLPAPDNWTADHKALFSKLPQDAQRFVLDRHGEMQADYTRKTQEISEFRRSAEPIVQAVEPFSKYVQSLGRSPADAVRTLLGTEYRLRTGSPQERAQIFAQLAVDYDIPLAGAHQLIQQGQVRQPVPLNPQHQHQIQQQDQRIAAMEQRDAQRAQAEQQRMAQAEIESFRSAKAADGRPKYPQYERVIGAMSDWLGSEPKELDGKSLPQMLEAAYAKFGAPIDEVIKTELAARQKQATEANKAAVAKAKGAVSVGSSGSAPRGSATLRDLDSIINGAMAKVGI